MKLLNALYEYGMFENGKLPEPIEEITISLPYAWYEQLKKEVADFWKFSNAYLMPPPETDRDHYTIQHGGIKFIIKKDFRGDYHTNAFFQFTYDNFLK